VRIDFYERLGCNGAHRDLDPDTIMTTVARTSQGVRPSEGGPGPPVPEPPGTGTWPSRRWPRGIAIRRKLQVFVIVALIPAIALGIHWLSTRNLISADNAFIDGDIVQISPKIAGSVLAIDVTDNQFVHRGDVLITLDTRDFQVAVDGARAALSDALAQLKVAQANLSLIGQTGSGSGAAPRDASLAADQAPETGTRFATLIRQANVQSAEAKVEIAHATLEQAELNLAYATISAPADGVVTRRRVSAGDQVDRRQELMVLVLGAPWVVANFKETQIARVRPSQSVDITIDAYPDVTFKGHVDSIQHSTGTRFALLSPESEMGHFVKVVQRVPVKIVFDEPPGPRFNVSLGMSVAATVNVEEAARAGQ
jgi:membrane fusion protein (multidrug efflux system)